MKSRMDLEIYNQLVKYLAKDISMKEFRDWFDSSTWNLQEMGANQDAWELAGEIELRLSEFSNAHWTEGELRNKLLPLVRTYAQREQSWGESGSWYRTSSSSVTVSAGVTVSQTEDLGSPAGIKASVVYG